MLPFLPLAQYRQILGVEYFSVRLACVRHAASVRPEPGSNSPIKFIEEPIGSFVFVVKKLFLTWRTLLLREAFARTFVFGYCSVFKVLRRRSEATCI